MIELQRRRKLCLKRLVVRGRPSVPQLSDCMQKRNDRAVVSIILTFCPRMCVGVADLSKIPNWRAVQADQAEVEVSNAGGHRVFREQMLDNGCHLTAKE